MCWQIGSGRALRPASFYFAANNILPYFYFFILLVRIIYKRRKNILMRVRKNTRFWQAVLRLKAAFFRAAKCYAQAFLLCRFYVSRGIEVVSENTVFHQNTVS